MQDFVSLTELQSGPIVRGPTGHTGDSALLG